MPDKPQLLLVEDDPSGREVAVYNLRAAGYGVDAAATGPEGLALFDATRHALVLTDLRLPGLDGMGLLGELRTRAPDVPIIMVTAFGDVDTAVEAMRRGAVDFLPKPFGREQLLVRVERALERAALGAEVRELRARAGGVERPIVATSEPMRRLLALVDRVAATDATVLVTGESGTGKELVARRLHARSRRSDGPFVTINCAAIPEQLLESELFGHEKGTFTGAVRARRGHFRRAHRGTVFLDEIGELPLAVQGRLLRVVQERLVDVLGADAPVEVDVRVVAATNRDLGKLVAEGRFREDLWYRLNVVEIALPPLRERLLEIGPLVRQFVAELAPERELAVEDALVEELARRAWPGNVRQLHNVCERLVMLCDGDRLAAAELPPERPSAGTADPFEHWPPLPTEGLSLVDLERRVIERVLAHKGGNVSQAAAYLRIPRHVLAYRMEKYGIRREGA
ncbi:MAG: sigma-54-dependent Fis family transcriptional regulator [Polyangiaceae bacterium]|nr:sigma-54-dependent Fis family transcriptional regulator [Polyangiaceae bacterium]